MTTLRLRCQCGRNVADVIAARGVSNSELGGLRVSTRPNVKHTVFTPHGYRMPPTYSWRCGCGRHHQRRHDRLTEAWPTFAGTPGRVVVAVLDVDL